MSRLSTVWKCALFGLVLVVAAGSLATAQEKKRSRAGNDDQKGGRGFGGRGFTPGRSTLLVSSEVKKELAIDDKQTGEITKILTDAFEKSRAEFSGFAGLGDLPEAERDKKIAEIREKSQKMNRETDEQIDKVLNDTQKTRLNELYLQLRGADVLNDPDVAKKLELSDDQKKKVADVITSQDAERRKMFTENTNLSREERTKKMEELRTKTEQSLLAVLTDKQKEEFTKMKGKPTDIDRTAIFRGLGGGRRGDAKK